jgi:transposase-like protein
MSIMAFLKQFPNDDACWQHLERVRWPHGPVCAKCGNVGPTMACGRKHYHQCKACNAKFTAAFGTPLEGTHLPMRTWFTALYLLAVSSKGLSSVALGRQLGVCQKTAWFLGHRIRAMMEDNCELLRGILEADPTDIGGKRKRDQKSRRDDDGDQPKGRGGSRKAMVISGVERGGKSRARQARTHCERTIATFLLGNVSSQSVLSTELSAYRWIGRKFRAHLRVNQSAGEYVRTDLHAAANAHSNTAESWNATLKRAIAGVWHWISIKHLDRYCTETALRWTHREHDGRLSALPRMSIIPDGQGGRKSEGKSS